MVKPFKHITCILQVLLFLFLVPDICLPDNTYLLMQKRGIGRLDSFIDNFRKTGDRASLFPELLHAEQELAASLDGFIRMEDRPAAALSLIKLGDVYRMLGKWDAAMDCYRQAYKLAAIAKHAEYQSKALMGMARAEMYGLRNYGDAALHIEEALQLSAGLQDKQYLFDALDYKGQVQIYRGDLIGAADSLNRALSLVPQIEDKALKYYVYLDRADVYQKLAEKCDYQRSFEPCYEALELSKADYEKALQIARQMGFHGLASQTEGFLQRLEIRRSMIKSQESFHKQLIQSGIFHPKTPDDVLVHEKFISGTQNIPAGILNMIQQSGAISGGDPRSVYIQGLMHEMQGDSDRALELYREAVVLLEKDRRNLKEEKSRGTFLEDKIEFYYTPMLHLLERGQRAEAFELMERSRSRAMADLLANKQIVLSDEASRSSYATFLRLKTDIAALQKRLFEYRAKPDSEKYSGEIAAEEKKISRLEGEYRKVMVRMAKDSPRLQQMVVSEPVSLKKLQHSMKKDGYEILEYLVLESQLVLWHISGDSVRVKSVFLPRSEVIKKVEALRKSLKGRHSEFNRQTAGELFLFLIQPILKWVKADHLVIVPHEDLNYIPFQVLMNPSDSSFLGERFQISYAPSATILYGLEKVHNLKGMHMLAAADPDIPEAPDEVFTITQWYPQNKTVTDFLLREHQLKAWASGYNILHLAVHGRFNASEPLLSYLELAEGGDDDGLMTAAEMFGLPLDKTRFVVLSACETGRAQATHANEVLGMVRALLYAGADSLILSSWKVDSASTALWMETFYKAVQTKSPGEAARLALKKVKGNRNFEHPYYWGPFMMIGK